MAAPDISNRWPVYPQVLAGSGFEGRRHCRDSKDALNATNEASKQDTAVPLYVSRIRSQQGFMTDSDTVPFRWRLAHCTMFHAVATAIHAFISCLRAPALPSQLR